VRKLKLALTASQLDGLWAVLHKKTREGNTTVKVDRAALTAALLDYPKLMRALDGVIADEDAA
jgi:hypothetical protein